jgi:thiol-disulfide isomerase/thioredoxin
MASRHAIAGLSCILAGCGAAAMTTEGGEPARIGAPLAELSFQLLGGGRWSLAAQRGRVTIIDVWATYCPPCRKSIPELNRLRVRCPDLAMVGVSVDEEDGVVREFLGQVPAEFPIARDSVLAVRGAPLYVLRLPTLFVLDRTGVVQNRLQELSADDYRDLAREIGRLCAPPGAASRSPGPRGAPGRAAPPRPPGRPESGRAANSPPDHRPRRASLGTPDPYPGAARAARSPRRSRDQRRAANDRAASTRPGAPGQRLVFQGQVAERTPASVAARRPRAT